MSPLCQRLADTGTRTAGTVHDKLNLDAPRSMTNNAAAILEETMIEAGKPYLERVPSEVEVAITQTWAEK